MEFRILGPLEADNADHPIAVGAGKQRAVLGLLLLTPGEPVSVDRLIEALWGEEPPAGAAKSVQVYVSGLRKALGTDRVVRRPPGYLVRANQEELDSSRFVDLMTNGRQALAAGEAENAASVLRKSLDLWRGPVLVDCTFGGLVNGEIGRLEELRLTALTERIEADLLLGRHADLVPELEVLLEAHPYQERFRAQLMLALYRSGRQVDALAAFKDARRTLVDELGIEPGPQLQQLERRILDQDPELEAPAISRSRTSALRPRRRIKLLLSAGAIFAALGLAALVAELVRGSDGPISVAAGSVASIDPRTNRIAASLLLPGGPARLASEGASPWVGDDDSGTVAEIDPRSHALTKLVATGGFPSDLAVGDGAVWVVDGKRGLLIKVIPAYGVVARVKVMSPNTAYDRDREGLEPTSVAVGAGSVWLTDGSSKLTRVDPRTARIVERIPLGQALNGVAATKSSVWVVGGKSATVIRLSRQGKVIARVPIVSSPGFESPYPLAIEAGAGFIWVLNGNTATVTKIDPEQRTVVATIPIGIDRVPVRLAVGDGSAWVANGDGTLSRIDAETNTLRTLAISHRLKDVVVTRDAVWVTTGTGLSGTTGSGDSEKAAVERLRPLPAASCSPIYSQPGARPTLLIASDLPLQGASRTAAAQIGQAIRFVLKQHKFRAGPYSVGYQSCDDSTAQTGFPAPAKCAANARTYARNPSVIAVIAPLNSSCTQPALAIENAAPNGPLPLVSFSNTVTGLTHSGPGAASDEPGRYYPVGTRNYIRIIAADNYQGAADALLARHLGAKRVYILREPSSYGTGLAAAFRIAARKIGLEIVGDQTWDWTATSYKPLASTVKRSRAGVVFLAGGLFSNGDTLVKDLRAGIDPNVRIIASDGFTPLPAVVDTVGSAAEGMTVSVAGVPNERLPRRGRDFVAAFGNAVDETPSPFAVYAAQAAEVLLNAISASDGTRETVRANLFKTDVSNGILGRFAIDKNGDTTANAITIYRITNGKPSIFDVITPPAGIVAGR